MRLKLIKVLSSGKFERERVKELMFSLSLVKRYKLDSILDACSIFK